MQDSMQEFPDLEPAAFRVGDDDAAEAVTWDRAVKLSPVRDAA
jgi:hypothetical protein